MKKQTQQESRPQMFHRFFEGAFVEVASQVWARGKNGHVGGYRWPATRRRVRELARKQARFGMRQARAQRAS